MPFDHTSIPTVKLVTIYTGLSDGIQILLSASGKACESLQVFLCFWAWRRPVAPHLSLTTMAAGSRKKYALDLNDIFAFPDGNNIPLRPPDTKNGESWVMLLEVGLLSLIQTPYLLCGNVDFHSAKRYWDLPLRSPD